VTKKDEATGLRGAAEARLKAGPATAAVDDSDLLRLVHELQVHQIELEMQNKELLQIRAELETALTDYTELYDFAPVGYLTLTSDGLISKINLTGSVLLGEERMNLLKKRFTSFIIDEDQVRWTRHFLSVKSHDGQGKVELALQRGDGTVLHAQMDCVRYEVGAGENPSGPHTLGVRIALTDISERKQAEEARQTSEARLNGLVSSAMDAIITIDSNHRITLFNPAAADMFGLTSGEVLGSNLDRLIPSRFRSTHSDQVHRYGETQVSARTMGNLREILGLRADGNEFPMEASIAQLEVNGEKTFTVVLRDITERKRMDQVLQDKNTELENAKFVAEKANLAKSDFLSSMSHELRTPLSAILGFAQLIESGSTPPTPSQKRSIDQILHAGWYLLELVNEILDLALIESGKLSLWLEPVSLAEVMHECQTMIEPQAQKHGISVAFPQFKTPYFVHVDRTRVKQALINLLSNAIKYNKVGGTVAVDCIASTPGRIRISVEDTGEGLAPEKLSQLFQPFNRLGQEANTEEGTGIGLVVCKRLIELMGGVIGVESTVGKGSVFWIEINLTTEPQVAPGAAEHTVVAQAQAHAGAQLQTLLYVEDNPANLKLVEDIIARRPDIRLLSAWDGNHGIEIARASLPDVILMDINLPGISGLKALRILAEDPATAHIPVVALSANAMLRDIEKGLEAGFFRYLTKPIKVNELMDTLDVAFKFAKTEAVLAAKKDQA
jgi:PAS domain S-box-containing protein